MIDVHNAGTYWRVAYISESPPADQCIEEWRKMYPQFSDLPPRTQLAVAILRMAGDGEQVNSIGRRVSDKTFWLHDNKAMLAEYTKEEQT